MSCNNYHVLYEPGGVLYVEEAAESVGLIAAHQLTRRDLFASIQYSHEGQARPSVG